VWRQRLRLSKAGQRGRGKQSGRTILMTHVIICCHRSGRTALGDMSERSCIPIVLHSACIQSYVLWVGSGYHLNNLVMAIARTSSHRPCLSLLMITSILLAHTWWEATNLRSIEAFLPHLYFNALTHAPYCQSAEHSSSYCMSQAYKHSPTLSLREKLFSYQS